MRRAFSLLEMIFVIVIIGILAKIGMAAFRTDYLLHDAHHVALALERAKYRGIGYDHRPDLSQDVTGACVTLTEEALRGHASSGEAHYRLHSTLSGSLSGKTVCFDRLGRPHDDGRFLSDPMMERKMLVLRYRGKEKRIFLLPESGYAIIK